MSDLDISTAGFTSSGMILTGLDDLGTVWGSALAKNTGYLLRMPRTILNFSMGSAKTGTVGEGYVYLTQGSWTLQYSVQNPVAHTYTPALWFCHATFTYGSTLIVDETSGATEDTTGSVFLTWFEDGLIKWDLVASDADSMCTITVQAVRNKMELL